MRVSYRCVKIIMIVISNWDVFSHIDAFIVFPHQYHTVSIMIGIKKSLFDTEFSASVRHAFKPLKYNIGLIPICRNNISRHISLRKFLYHWCIVCFPASVQHRFYLEFCIDHTYLTWIFRHWRDMRSNDCDTIPVSSRFVNLLLHLISNLLHENGYVF